MFSETNFISFEDFCFVQERKHLKRRLAEQPLRRVRPEMRCIARFHAIKRKSRSNANMPSTLASISRVSSSVDSFFSVVCVIWWTISLL